MPAVLRASQVLAQDIARTPIKLRRKVADGHLRRRGRARPVRDPGHAAEPGDDRATQFKAAMHAQPAALRARLCGDRPRRWAGGGALAARPVRGCASTATRQRRKRWTYTAPAGSRTSGCSTRRAAHLRADARHAVCALPRPDRHGAGAADVHGEGSSRNGGRLTGVLQAHGAVSQETADRLRDVLAATRSATPGNSAQDRDPRRRAEVSSRSRRRTTTRS